MAAANDVDVSAENPPRLVIDAGNGGAGVFAYQVLQGLGCMTLELHCDPDTSYPNYFPNPSDLEARKRLAELVTHPYIHADLGIGFDGDGDRCGVVDNEGEEIFADKVGVIMARDLSKLYPGSTFVADVKSTGLFASDPELA